MLIRRDLEPSILEAAQYFPIIAIVGPRQSGKTTLARMLFKDYKYVSLEDLDIRSEAARDPRTFLVANRSPKGMIIDEFQYVPELLSYIKTIVDEEKKNGYFVLTGSQNFLMNQAITQSLAGRVSIHTLLPLSVHELTENNLLPAELETMLYQGSYPAIYAQNTPPPLLYKNYLQTYIERDVRQLTQVGDLLTFQTFITLCAARVGQILNITSLANDCGISDHTAKRWISILEASYIIFLVRPYRTTFGKRLIKAPKIFFYDTGLVCTLLKMGPQELATYPIKGNIFESFVVSEIFKWYFNRNEIPAVYFWRDHTGHEVDCIIEHGKTVIPVEMKASRTISEEFFEGLEDWNVIAKQKAGAGFVVYGGSESQTRTRSHLISWQKLDEIFQQII